MDVDEGSSAEVVTRRSHDREGLLILARTQVVASRTLELLADHASGDADVAVLRSLADSGNPEAMTRLGRALAAEGDVVEARVWWARAASAGNAEASFQLGHLSQHGAHPDLDGAKAWYERAAERGYGPAFAPLAACCLRLGTPESALS